MKLIPAAVTRNVARQLLQGQKFSPTILFGVGVVGVVATTVLASRATLRLDEVLEDTNKKLEGVRTLQNKAYSEDDRKKDKALLYGHAAIDVAKLYAPAVAVGVISVAALTGSHIILTRRNVALTAAYAALDKGFKEYRQRVVAEVGPEKDREYRYGGTPTETLNPATGKLDKTSLVRIGPKTPSIYARFFDETNPMWQTSPEYNRFFITCQQNYFNDILRNRGHVFLNEVYDRLGMDRSKEGSVVGWVMGEGDSYIDFGMFNVDNQKAREFVNGREASILLDFNVDGVIYDKI